MELVTTEQHHNQDKCQCIDTTNAELWNGELIVKERYRISILYILISIFMKEPRLRVTTLNETEIFTRLRLITIFVTIILIRFIEASANPSARHKFPSDQIL